MDRAMKMTVKPTICKKRRISPTPIKTTAKQLCFENSPMHVCLNCVSSLQGAACTCYLTFDHHPTEASRAIKAAMEAEQAHLYEVNRARESRERFFNTINEIIDKLEEI